MKSCSLMEKLAQLGAGRRPLDVCQHGKSWLVQFLIGSLSFSTTQADGRADRCR